LNGDVASVRRATDRPEGPSTTCWEARLEIGFDHVAGRTVMTRRRHYGPLIVQKPLYPEGPAVCQCVIVHPPAGIVGGDRVGLQVTVGRDSIVQLTTPGASKWYRSAGALAEQSLDASVAENATLEWLPQGTIVYDGALARSTTRVNLATTASFVGIDIVSLGRRAAGERFRCGEWRQRYDVVRNAAPIWSERSVIGGGSRWLASPAGLNDASVFGTFVAVGPRIDETMMNGLRDIARTHGEIAVTLLPDVIIARYLGDSMEVAHAGLCELWMSLRPALTGRAATRPRIWST
jgi:urease accessory protein